MTMIAISRAIGPVPIDCVISEKHNSEIEIAEIPIETGSRITDHAFVLPKRVTLEIADRNAVTTFNALVTLQESRVPFTLITGLKVYKNMLISRIDPERDKDSARILRGTADLQEVVIVATAYTPDEGGRANGEPGGRNSTRHARLSRERAGDTTTADRVSETSQRGDVDVSTAVEDKTILQRIFSSE